MCRSACRAVRCGADCDGRYNVPNTFLLCFLSWLWFRSEWTEPKVFRWESIFRSRSNRCEAGDSVNPPSGLKTPQSRGRGAPAVEQQKLFVGQRGLHQGYAARDRAACASQSRIVSMGDFPFTVGIPAGLCPADTPSISHMCDILQVSSYFSRAQSATLPVSLSPMAWRAPSCRPCR